MCNSGGGVLIRDNSNPTLINVIIEDNTAVHGGGAFCYFSSPTFINCTLAKNTATSFGGGLRCGRYSSPALVNCTIAYNISSGTGGGAIIEDSSQPTFDNCIIAFNEGESIYCFPVSEASLSCCDLYGNTGGDWVGCIEDQEGINGNITMDPLFCNGPGGDFGLEDESPCGPSSPPNVECELIGAWPVGCDPTGIEDGSRSMALHLAPCVPNPLSHATLITYAIPETRREHGVRLRIFDASGRLVRTLVSEPQGGGFNTVRWDGVNEAGEPVANGLYFYRLQWNGLSSTRRMVLLR